VRSPLAIVQSITLPSNAIPGQARLVIGADLPPPLDTYTTLNGPYVAALIFYSQGDDTTYSYIGVVEDSLTQLTIVHWGHVVSGAVVEDSGGVPRVEERLASAGTVAHTIRADDILMVAGALGVTLNSAAALLFLAATSATITADTVNLDPATELQLRGTKAYVLTDMQADSLVPNVALTAANVSMCQVAVNTATANARYEAQIVCLFDSNAAIAVSAIGELDVDGLGSVQGQAILEVATASDRATVTQVYTGVLATAGPHTFDLMARKTAAVGTVFAGGNNCTRLLVKIYESGG
jgi:hypothetical protein